MRTGEIIDYLSYRLGVTRLSSWQHFSKVRWLNSLHGAGSEVIVRLVYVCEIRLRKFKYGNDDLKAGASIFHITFFKSKIHQQFIQLQVRRTLCSSFFFATISSCFVDNCVLPVINTFILTTTAVTVWIYASWQSEECYHKAKFQYADLWMAEEQMNSCRV